ncbi:MAG: PepSY-associated TM helix domain-containing protein [Pseudomonadota bacterium]
MSTTIWPKSSAKRVSRSLKAHSIVALALGGLIYVLALTGTLSVFNREFQRWEQPTAPEMTSIAPEAAALAAKTVFERKDPTTTHLYINFPQPDLPRTVITTDTQAFFANPDGTIAFAEKFPWTQFLLDLHYYLHLPHILGLTVVGALGAFLIAMSISGFLAHPRIFRDAFRYRRGEGRVPLTDLHNRLSVWTAPFHISNALTGAILGLASILGFAIATVSFNGDITKVFSPVFGEDPVAVEEKAILADIAGPLAYMGKEFPAQPPTFFILHDPGTAGQHSSVIAKHTDRLIFGEYYQFDANGTFKGTVGLADGTVGQQIVGSVYNVHFGNWGGLPVKVAYVIFGLSLTTIIASGLRIYFVRRREQGRPAPRLEASWEAIVWGTPALLALSLPLALSGVLDERGLVPVFWLGLMLVNAIAVTVGDASFVSRMLRIMTMVLVVFGVVFHLSLNPGVLLSYAVWPISASALLAASLGLLGPIKLSFRAVASPG